MFVERQRLIVEAFECQASSELQSIEFVYNFLEELSQIINMRILVPPVVVRVPVLNACDRIATNKDYGVSGAVIWLESGAQLHTWPEHSFLALDVFSCKPFEEQSVDRLVKEKLKPKYTVLFNPTKFISDKSAQSSDNLCLTKQVGGSHYKKFKIQPIEFIHSNNLGYIEGNIIKYICRYKDKGGIEDLDKIKHYVDILIKLEEEKEESKHV